MLITRKSGDRSWLMLIAEFILVVGGVLVALWLDSVKQSYRDRLLEKQYLEELEEDGARYNRFGPECHRAARCITANRTESNP